MSPTASAAHAETTIEDILITPEVEQFQACRNVAVTERFRRWEDSQTPPNPFASVNEISKEVNPPTFEAAVEKGCNRDFFAFFMACTQHDDPNASNIVPSGIMATSETELSALILVCLRAASLTNLPIVQQD